MSRRESPYFQTLLLDLLVTAIVICVALAMLLPNVVPATFKARFLNVLYAMSNERNPLIERHAHTGVWTETHAEGTGPQARPSARTVDYRIDTAQGSVVAAGTLSGRAFRVDLRPAVADAARQWSVLWLCGARRPPAGWTVAGGPAQLELPPDLALSMCRKEGSTNRVPILHE